MFNLGVFVLVYCPLLLALIGLLVHVHGPSVRVHQLAAGGIYVSVVLVVLLVPTFWWYVGYAGQGWRIGLSNGKAFLVVSHDPRFAYPKGTFCEYDESIGDIIYAPFPVVRSDDRFAVISVPVAALAFLIALLSLVARIRARGYPTASCPACSYDLTGNVSGVCPECGRAV